MKALVLTALAVAFLAAVLIGAERLGYLMPSQEPEAYEARLVIANGVVAKTYEKSFGPSSSIAKSMDETVIRLEQKNPEIVASNRAEVNRIHDMWRVKAGDYLLKAYAHFFAKNFTTVALERMRDGRQPLLPDLRAFVVWYMRQGEFQLIGVRGKHFSLCLLFVDVLPALSALGMTGFDGFDERKNECAHLIAAGRFNPKNAAL